MLRIRFHGRGGQGMKTASRILGTALFLEGYEVQDAPRYGAERRGAPIFAYVRADKAPIHERGIIAVPDLVVVADDTLMGVTAAGATEGMDAQTIMLVATNHDLGEWRERLQTEARLLPLRLETASDPLERPHIGAACAGAAARLLGVVSPQTLKTAVETELADFPTKIITENVEGALKAYEAVSDNAGCVTERPALSAQQSMAPRWIDLPHEDADISAPAIHHGMTSVQVRTGLWRTVRPVLNKDACNKCTWVCGSFCPDGVISVDAEGFPEIDFDQCKGCMICIVQCPKHALVPVPESEAAAKEGSI